MVYIDRTLIIFEQVAFTKESSIKTIAAFLVKFNLFKDLNHHLSDVLTKILGHIIKYIENEFKKTESKIQDDINDQLNKNEGP